MNEFETIENELHKLRMNDPTFNTDLIQSACKKLEKASKLLEFHEMANEWTIGKINDVSLKVIKTKFEDEIRYHLLCGNNYKGDYLKGYDTFEDALKEGRKLTNG